VLIAQQLNKVFLLVWMCDHKVTKAVCISEHRPCVLFALAYICTQKPMETIMSARVAFVVFMFMAGDHGKPGTFLIGARGKQQERFQ
jgi:hypothetical protein